MLRGILVVALYGIGSILSLQAIAYACSFWIWSEIFRPISWSRYWLHMPVSEIVAGALLVSIALNKWARRWNVVVGMFLFVTIWAFLSSAFATHESVAMARSQMYAKYLIPLAVISVSLVTRPSQNMFIWTLAAAVGVHGAQAGVHCLLTGNPEIGMGITGGQMNDRNTFIVGVVSCIPLLFYSAWSYNLRGRRSVRIAAKCAALLSIVAVFFSLSRGGLVGIACLAVYWVVATGRFRRRVLVAAIVLCIGIPLFPSFVSERLQTVELDTSYQSEGSAAERLMIAKAALKAAVDNPVVGVGPRNFQHVAPIYGSTGELMVSHSLWLQAAAEFGFPMLITFLVLIVYLLLKLGRERRAARQRKDSETEMLATALACSLIGFLAAGTFTSQFMAPYLWGLLGVIGAFIAHCGYKRNQGELDPQGETKEAETGTPQPARTA